MSCPHTVCFRPLDGGRCPCRISEPGAEVKMLTGQVEELEAVLMANLDVTISKDKRIKELEAAYRALENGTDGVVMRRALRAEATIKRLTEQVEELDGYIDCMTDGSMVHPEREISKLAKTEMKAIMEKEDNV